MPEIVFKTREEIPEGIRDGAKEVEGGFSVNVVLNSKLQEFRDRNIEISRERDSMKQRLEKLNPVVGDDLDAFLTELPELRKTAQQVQDGKLKTTDAIEREVQSRISSMQEGFAEKERGLQTAIAQLKESDASWKRKYERSVLDQQITTAVIAADSVANPSALPDILARAAALFVVDENGAVIPKRGGEVIYGADGVNPMTPKEWLTKLVAEAPYLGKASSGGGAAGGKGGAEASYGMSNADFQKLPPQERIRLARAAGKKA